MLKTTSIALGILAALFLFSPLIAEAFTVFLSGQVGSSPANGFVLQTNGTNSTWVATSSLGITGGGGGSTLITAGSGISTSTSAGGAVLVSNTGVLSFNSRTGAVVPGSSDYTTSQVAEGSNLYWTPTRFDNRLSATTSLPNIITLANLSLPYSQLTGTPTIYPYPFPAGATTSKVAFNGALSISGATSQLNAELDVANNTPLTFLGGSTCGNTSTLKTGSDGTFLYDLGCSMKIKDASGHTVGLSDGSFNNWMTFDGTTQSFSITTGSASTISYASTTALSATTLCLSTDCRTVWPSGTGSGLATTSPVSGGNLLEYSATGAGSAFGVATGTVSAGTGISVTAGQSIIGSGLTITNSSPLSGLTAGFPFSFSNPALSWIGLATSSNISAGQALYATGVNTIAGTATTTLVAGSNVSFSGGTPVVFGSSPVTINATGGSFTNTLANGGTATTTFYNGGVVFSDGTKLTQSAAAANFFWDETNKRLGIGTTTPNKSFVVEGATTGGVALFQRDFAAAVNQAVGTFTTNLNETGGVFDNTGPFQTFSISNNNAPATILGDIGAVRNGADNTGTFQIRPYTAGVAQSILYVAGTGVGVASSSPTANLSVFAPAGGSTLHLFDIGSSTATFATTTLFTVLNNGNVGIGTTSPFTTLGVVGTITANNINATSTTATSLFSGTLSVIGHLITVISAAFTPATAGEIGIDTTANQLKYLSNGNVQVLQPEQSRSFTYATSTWTATTTIPLDSVINAYTFTKASCYTDTGTLNVVIGQGTASTTIFNASTTNGIVTFTTNNSMATQNKVKVDIGTPASSPTKIVCTAAYTFNAQ